MITKFNMLNESPDNIIYNGKFVSWSEGIAFGYYKSDFYVHDKTHMDLTASVDGNYGGRTDMELPGRIFVLQRIITFWTYPDPEEMQNLIEELENLLEITIDDEWLIEIKIRNGVINKNKKWYRVFGDTEFIKPSQYEYYWSKVQESKLYESPNQVSLPNGRMRGMCGGGGPEEEEIVFLYDYNGDFHWTKGCQAHCSVANGCEYYRERDISGRLFCDIKIITFWKFPKDYEDLMIVIKDIENYTEEKIDSEWKIEVPKNVEELENASKQTSKTADGDYDNSLYKFISIDEYMGGAKTSTEEMKVVHLMNWEEKQELKKKGWGKGFGSDMTKLKKK